MTRLFIPNLRIPSDLLLITSVLSLDHLCSVLKKAHMYPDLVKRSASYHSTMPENDWHKNCAVIIHRKS